jgi:hypothetical protein
MNIKTMKLIMESDQPITGDAAQLRGFFAHKFSSYLLLHHHLGNNRYLYQYPRIQYKDIDGDKMVLGLAEGIEVLQSIYNQYDWIELDGYKYRIYSKEISIKEESFGLADEKSKYQFITPWFALNEENYEKYKNYSYLERSDQLRSILIRNIMSIAKTFQYFVENRIVAEINLKEISIDFKGKDIIGFLGTFKVNFHLPNYIGLGKSVSRGFGTIKRIGSDKNKLCN